MYALKDVAHTEIAAEIAAMAEFLAARWNKVENVDALLGNIAKTAEQNAESAIDRNTLPTYLMEKLKQRRHVLESFAEKASTLTFYDQIYQLFQGLQRQVDKVHSNGDDALYEAYESTFKGFKKFLTAPELSHLKKAQPKGFAAMTKHYCDDDEAWDKALEDEFTDRHAFKGATTPYDGSGGFVSRVSLISAVQENYRHNTSCIDMLIGGAYLHFVALFKHRNTQAILADLNVLEPQVQAKTPCFTLDFTPTHKLTRVLYALAREEGFDFAGEDPEKAYLAELAECQKQPSLTDDELKARKVDALAMLQSMMRNTLKPETAKQAKQREAEKARERQAVQDALKRA